MSKYYTVVDCRVRDLVGSVAGDVVHNSRVLGYDWATTPAIKEALSMAEGFSTSGGTFGVFEWVGRGFNHRRCLAVYVDGVLVSGLIGSICIALVDGGVL